MEDRKVLLSIRDLHVKFRVRGRVLTAIRGASLDIYEDESIAIVGESGCGKSVLTKTFAGMLDNNGFIDQGDVYFNDDSLTETTAPINVAARRVMDSVENRLNEYAKLESGAATYRKICALEKGEDGKKAPDAAGKLPALKEQYKKECAGEISARTKERNKRLAKEVHLSLSRYPAHKRAPLLHKVMEALRKAMELGVDLEDEEQLNHVFETALFRVKYLDETPEEMHGRAILNMAKENCVNSWTEIRGRKVATIFQDPMTSLNPILTIGSQITSVIMRHQKVSELEARKRAIVLMKKVGIPNAENRFDDYPFQYSGGMRQRIVIAIALSCHPKLLICDEPTTALDVTIQAQILKLIKDLQKEFHYTIVFITHDLGVVANMADRVAVLYAGQIIEVGTVEEIFYDPRHPYTWVLLSSLPQLMDRDSKLYSIAGTPPSLYNKVIGDAFAPRNPYALKIDTIKEPPMFQVSETHFAKTWLLDPRAPKTEKPEIIRDIHGTLIKVFNI